MKQRKVGFYEDRSDEKTNLVESPEEEEIHHELLTWIFAFSISLVKDFSS